MIAVLLSVLLAYFLDPVVTGFERVHIPRALGALLVLLAATAALGAVGYLSPVAWTRLPNDWPRYSAVLKRTPTPSIAN